MTTNEYLFLTRKIFSLYENEPDIDFLRAILKEGLKDQNCNDTDIRVISSNSIFPEIVTNNQKNTIIWEMTFWDFYNRFLYSCEYFSNAEDTVIREKISDDQIADFAHILSININLSPSLSYALAITAYGKTQNLAYLDKSVDSDKILLRMRISKTYTLLHELYHSFIKSKSNFFSDEYSQFRENNRERYAVFEKIKGNLDDSVSKKLLECMIVINNESDNRISDEILCDCFAFYHTSDLFNIIEIDNSVSPDIVLFLDTLNKLRLFNQVLINMLSLWKEIVEIYEKKIDVDSFNYSFDFDIYQRARSRLAQEYGLINIFQFSNIDKSRFEEILNIDNSSMQLLENTFSSSFKEFFSQNFFENIVSLAIDLDDLGFIKDGWLKKMYSMLNARMLL